MAGTHLISSSLFIQSGSVAHFKNGINVTGSFSSSVPIYAAEFDGLGTNTTSTPTLNVGKSNEDGTFEEWTTPTNASIRITASGDFDGFCFIENAVQANILAATAKDNSKNQVYNCALGDRTSLNELFNLIKEALIENGIDISKSPIYRDFRAGDVRHSQADITKASNLLGYMPEWKISAGIKKATPWYIKYLSSI